MSKLTMPINAYSPYNGFHVPMDIMMKTHTHSKEQVELSLGKELASCCEKMCADIGIPKEWFKDALDKYFSFCNSNKKVINEITENGIICDIGRLADIVIKNKLNDEYFVSVDKDGLATWIVCLENNTDIVYHSYLDSDQDLILLWDLNKLNLNTCSFWYTVISSEKALKLRGIENNE